MKIKKYLLGSLIILCGISLTDATYNGGGINVPIGEYVQVSDICNTNDNFNVGNYITFDNNLNIKYIENGIEYNGFKFHSCGRQGIWGYLYWNDNKLTYGGDFQTNGGDTNLIPDNVGHINNVCSTTKGNICTTTGGTITMSEFINTRKTRESFTIIPQPTDANAPTYGYLVICFNATDITYCINYNLANSGSSLGFTHYNPTNIGQAHYNLPITDWTPYFSSSPMRGTNTNNYGPINTTCPTIGQVKQSYGLNESICYAGFTENDIYGDNSTYNAGTGMDIMSVYLIYSGGMNLQSRYDTYYEYYNNINNNVNMFQGKSKALLGTFFSRQTFGKNKSSYTILNYCNLVLGNLPDNATTCTASPEPGEGQLTGGMNLPVEQATPTRQEMIESIINRKQETIIPNTGTIYDDIVNTEQYNTRDIINALNNVYTKITSIFQERGNTNGIIPDYITGLICLIVLFKLRKK